MGHALTVSRLERLCPDAVAVSFALPPELQQSYAFRAGQFLTLHHGSERRSYSICAAPGEPLRVAVRRVEGGLLSQWLTTSVRVGDEVEVEPPTGRFHTGDIVGGRHLLIAAGSGITPMIGIAKTLLSTGAEVTLIYANRRTSTVMFVDEIADLKDCYLDSFQVIHVLSREPRDVDLFSGRLDPDRLRAIVDQLLLPGSIPAHRPIDHAWLCGPHTLITQARELLQEHVQQIHVELFYVEEAPPEQARHVDRPPTGATSQVSVVLDGKMTTAALPTDQTILDAAQRLRADLPFACKGGVCGTCRAKVTSGEVDMRRNYALEDSEVADGFVLTCQSHPVSAQVTIDFDA